jgi:hypothetical protein
VSTQVFAGIVADIMEDHNLTHLGSVALNTEMYQLAASQNASSCNNSGSTPLANASACVFRDVTTGTISMPCETGTTDCGSTISSQVLPVAGPLIKFHWSPIGIFLLACFFFAATFLLRQQVPQQRWSAVLTVVILGLMFGMVSCGGGSGNGTVGGGGGGGASTVRVLSGYNAGVGYDRATGLGTINAANLANANGW